ncbi:MFS transporter [Deinococcus marmoris]|uniref:Major facilitator superfamily MFS_1 n=1 Tax=Deinococcus marmoris TaxID=249408 RepID=A0A1U7NSY0_9DEIO|nr:MFS transporter [Deinococcus marmoris]OLV16015.1 major facilitator superfamily MFS_1 [Deinococcus marmoris]
MQLQALAGLPRNARNAILMEPLWGVFGVVVLYYAPLYMSSVGLSSTQIGLLGSMTLALSFLFQAVAAPITNRVGRKRTTLIGDLISWTVPMFVWAFAQSFAAFALAAVLAASGRIVTVSWSLLLIEDVEEWQRARVFGIINLIVTVCGLLTPLVGLVIAQHGVTATMRGFYILGGVGMTVMFLWRNAITDETRSGVAAMAQHRELGLSQSVRHTLGLVAGMRGHPGLMGITIFYLLTVFIEQLSLFQILFLQQTLNFSAQTLSFVPFVAAFVTLLLYGVALPRLSRLPLGRTLMVVRALGLIGAVALLFVPAGNTAAMLAAVGLLGGVTFLTLTYRDAALFSRLPQNGTADLFSAVQTLTLLCAIPAAGLAGALFAASPRSLFVLIAALCAVLLLLAVWLARREERPQATGA